MHMHDGTNDGNYTQFDIQPVDVGSICICMLKA